LVGTAARTAVVAGTATAVAGKVHASQQAKAQAAQAQAAPAAAPAEAMPPPAPDDSADPLSQLEKLANLYQQGILTAEEFTAKAVPILVP
jgi:hypothetical protein